MKRERIINGVEGPLEKAAGKLEGVLFFVLQLLFYLL